MNSNPSNLILDNTSVGRQYSMSILDISVFIISVLGIFLEMYQRPLFWLSYIIAAIILGYQFYTTHLYGSFILQIIYVVLSIYGWYKWTHKDSEQHQVLICHTTSKQWIYYTFTTIFLGILTYFILKHTGDQDYLTDATLTAVSITATYMAAAKQIESWFVFTLSGLISSYLCYRYQLYFTCLTYIIFSVLDFIGGFKWLIDHHKLNKKSGTKAILG